MMREMNANSRRRSVEVIEDVTQDGSNPLCDPANPVFAAPKPIEVNNKKRWKRKLVGLCFLLFLIAGGVLALYLLLRVRHVNVKVQADSRSEPMSARSEPSPNNSENGLSAEAIDIARQAIGPDAAAATSEESKGSPSPTPSPRQVGTIPRMLSYTDSSPAYPQPNDAVSSKTYQNTTNSNETHLTAASDPVGPGLQSRSNTTQTLFVEDPPPKGAATPQTTNHRHIQRKTVSPDSSKDTDTAVLPVFGTLLPVRTQGVILSLRNNSFARLELTRDCEGEGWSLPKGTRLIGRVNGSEYDRAFIALLGYIDQRTNRFVKMTGEVLGTDGGSGMQGKRVVVDRNRLKQTFSRVASSGLQIAGMMAGALTGGGTVVLNGAGNRLLNPITDEAGRIVNGGDAKRSFVKVEAGQPAYVMVAGLPKELHGLNAPGEDEFARAAAALTDREVMELILFGTPQDIQAAVPLMNEEQKRLVQKSNGVEK